MSLSYTKHALPRPIRRCGRGKQERIRLDPEWPRLGARTTEGWTEEDGKAYHAWAREFGLLVGGPGKRGFEEEFTESGEGECSGSVGQATKRARINPKTSGARLDATPGAPEDDTDSPDDGLLRHQFERVSSSFKEPSYVRLGALLKNQHGIDGPVSRHYLKMLREEAKQWVLDEGRSIWDRKLWSWYKDQEAFVRNGTKALDGLVFTNSGQAQVVLTMRWAETALRMDNYIAKRFEDSGGRT
jgi:hypothetical protein